MGNEEFKSLSRELLPLFEQMYPIFRQHGIKRLVNITMNAEGYLSVMTAEAPGTELLRLEGDAAPMVKVFESL